MKKRFIIEWMTCASCVLVNENSLNGLNWVDKISINLATNIASIEFDESKISFLDIKKEIESNWYKVNENVDISLSSEKKEINKTFKRFIYSLIFSFPVFLMIFIDPKVWISFFGVDISMIFFAILSWIVVFIFWAHFHKNFFKSLLKFQFNMDSLVSIWTLTAFFYSIIAMFFSTLTLYFEASVSIITLINLWKYLEYRAKTKAWDAIWKLIQLWTKEANVLVNWKIISKDIILVNVWDILVVKPWEKIPLDSVIIEWGANIDESMLTWESIPVFKDINNDCFGWTINLDWNIKVKVLKKSNEWTLASIIKMVEDAQSSKAPIQKMADKVSSIFVPTIIVISVITFITWYLITWDISKAIITSVASLVIACPCALWLATPTAIMVWTWVWAKNWILIKNAETLEKTKDIDIVIFDKTWTLTNWKPEVTDVISFNNDKDNLIIIAKSLSILSNHPLSKSIVSYKSKWEYLKVENFEEIKWKWIVWEIKGEKIFLWNKKLFENIEIKIEVLEEIEKLTKSGKTPIIIWNEKEIIWIFWLLDLPKLNIENTIKELHSMKIETMILTWDTKNTAEFIASQIWIDNVIAEVLPEDKLNIIIQEQAKWKKVAFVWDWINDAPALVKSDLWIAMWTWSDIAIESSDIVLVAWDLQKVVQSIRLSRDTLKTIKQNLFWAFVYNSIWIPLAVFWILNPIFASFAMSMSSVSVISNSLRLKFFK